MSFTSITPDENVDWDDFACRKVSFNINTLAQYAAAGVDVVTVQIGQLICEQFELSATGERNVSGALNNLPVFDSHDWSFGFGFDHIARNSAGSISLLTIAGALLEFYDEPFTGRVFHELAMNLNVPPDLAPSLEQWERFMHVANGVLATNRFGVMLDDLVRLDPYDRLDPAQEDSASAAAQKIHASPRSIARALQLVAKISSRKLEQVTIRGAEHVGWFAAIAEWLFDLRIAVYSASQEQLYSNCEYKSVQITLVYESRRPDALHQMSLQADSWTLHDPAYQRPIRESEVRSAQHGGRVEWNALFRTVFGEAFVSLIKTESSIFGYTVACAARTLQAITGREEGVPESLKAASWISGHGSVGAGLVETMTSWFVGASRGIPNMNHCLKLSLPDAVAKYEEQIEKLRNLCDCSICRKGSPKTAEYCQVAMLETIIGLVVILSRTIVAPELFPKRTGVKLIYDHSVRCERQVQRESLSGIERIARIYRDVFKANDATMLQISTLLFGAGTPEHIDDSTLALTYNGICAYTGLLYKFAGKHAQKGDVRIVSGSSQYFGKLSDRVIAYESFETDLEKSKTPEDREKNFMVCFPQTRDAFLTIKPVGGREAHHQQLH